MITIYPAVDQQIIISSLFYCIKNTFLAEIIAFIVWIIDLWYRNITMLFYYHWMIELHCSMNEIVDILHFQHFQMHFSPEASIELQVLSLPASDCLALRVSVYVSA